MIWESATQSGLAEGMRKTRSHLAVSFISTLNCSYVFLVSLPLTSCRRLSSCPPSTSASTFYPLSSSCSPSTSTTTISSSSHDPARARHPAPARHRPPLPPPAHYRCARTSPSFRPDCACGGGARVEEVESLGKQACQKRSC